MTESTWTTLQYNKDLRIQIRGQQHIVNNLVKLRFLRCWARHKRNVSVHSRSPEHTARLQLATTVLAYRAVAQQFRRQRNQDWKDWINLQASNLQHCSQQCRPQDIFRILQPKKIIARAQHKLRKPLPQMKGPNDEGVHGRVQLAAAWENHFTTVENANTVPLTHLASAGPSLQSAHSAEALLECPDIYTVEDALRSISDRKAAGVDGLGAEIFQKDIFGTAAHLCGILTKGALRGDWAPEWSGGWLIPLHKGRGSQQELSSYRGILLEPVLARILARSWRNKYEQGLANIAAEMQYGGRKGLAVESLHLQVKLWQENGAAAKTSHSLLFVDIKAAFYSVAKPLLTGHTGKATDLERLFKTMGLPDSAFPAFLRNVFQGSIVYSATGSKTLIKHDQDG